LAGRLGVRPTIAASSVLLVKVVPHCPSPPMYRLQEHAKVVDGVIFGSTVYKEVAQSTKGARELYEATLNMKRLDSLCMRTPGSQAVDSPGASLIFTI
jgi:hypothetical protein